uniref:Uncharacterized protein n=1 Tax=Anguilla anguilla TaxID=7936 RepID=A0A0E9V6E4_ANGAN
MHKINNTTFILLLNIRLWLEEFLFVIIFKKGIVIYTYYACFGK